jgi:hypothetical protein
MAISPAAAITTAELHASKEYLALTEKQRVWLDVFISTQDAQQATKTAYKSVGRYAQMFTYEIEANLRIRAALNLYWGRSKQEVLEEQRLRSVKQLVRATKFQLRHTEPGSTAAQRLTSQLQSLLLGGKVEAEDPEPAEVPPAAAENATPAPPKAKYFVGQLLDHLDNAGVVVKVRVLNLDADGIPVDLEEVL